MLIANSIRSSVDFACLFAVDGMTMPQILEFFRGAEQEMEREVGVWDLPPEELEALLQEDEELRTLVQ